jgi:PAS domain S-box-containing protein
MNFAAERLLGRPAREFIGKIQWEAFPACAGSEAERQYRRAMTESIAVHFDHHYVDPGVYDFWLEIHAYPSADGINLLYRDISERKLAEEELRKFQFLADNAADVFFLIDSDGGLVYVNSAACRILGYSHQQFARMYVTDIDVVRSMTFYQSLFELTDGDRLAPFETTYCRADGSTIPVEASVTRLNIGAITLLFSSGRDITERKAAEVELLAAAARQRRFLRDVLASVTEGRLVLCQSEEELPHLAEPVSAEIQLSMAGGIRDLRIAASDACISNGLADERRLDLITAASEAGMNAAVHAGKGIGRVFANNVTGMIQVTVSDQGPGISLENLPNATLRKGFTTAGTLGHGMKMILQSVDRVFLLTGPNGTRVVIEQERLARLPEW